MSFELPEIAIDVTDRVAPFFDALADGTVLFQRCNACDAATSYEFARCETCQSDDLVAEKSSGVATLVTWTVIDQPTHKAFTDLTPNSPKGRGCRPAFCSSAPSYVRTCR